MGKPLVRDVMTRVDTLAASHVATTAAVADAATANQENLKRRKNASSVKTLDPRGLETSRFHRDLSTRLIDVSRDRKAGLYFGQRVGVAIQCANATSALGNFPTDNDMGLIDYLFIIYRFYRQFYYISLAKSIINGHGYLVFIQHGDTQ